MRKRIRLTESDLHRVIRESVKNVLREWDQDYWDDYDRKQAARRAELEREDGLNDRFDKWGNRINGSTYRNNYDNRCGYGNTRYGYSDNRGDGGMYR